MKINVILALSLLILSFSVKKDDEFLIGDKAPLVDYSMKGIDNQNTDLKSALGKNGLLVVFSCNTCPFVVGNENFVGWEKQYNDLFAKAKDQNINFVLINSNEAKREDDDSFENMQKHALEKQYKMSYLVDTDSKLANAFGAKTTPHVFLLDSDLKLAYKGSIDNSWDNSRTETIAYLENALKELSTKTKISQNTSEPRGCSIKRKK